MNADDDNPIVLGIKSCDEHGYLTIEYYTTDKQRTCTHSSYSFADMARSVVAVTTSFPHVKFRGYFDMTKKGDTIRH